MAFSRAEVHYRLRSPRVSVSLSCEYVYVAKKEKKKIKKRKKCILFIGRKATGFYARVGNSDFNFIYAWLMRYGRSFRETVPDSPHLRCSCGLLMRIHTFFGFIYIHRYTLLSLDGCRAGNPPINSSLINNIKKLIQAWLFKRATENEAHSIDPWSLGSTAGCEVKVTFENFTVNLQQLCYDHARYKCKFVKEVDAKRKPLSL